MDGMTEREWLNGLDPLTMLAFLQRAEKPSERKLRLFAVACSRRIWSRIDDLSRAAVEVAEDFADGLASPEQLRAARLACKSAGDNASWYSAVSNATIAARNAALSAQPAFDTLVERRAQAALLRDIFGNPFHPIPFATNWNTSAIALLAGDTYKNRDFEKMPILADALTVAGCDNEEMIDHARDQPPHVRGCWVVDLLLRKL